ncbi:hypothetical protein C5688_08685 [Methylocystis sp. MitZ-2018]|nr:hypothetical protein C5688_08685 [Methylocystis sp. MitZ-2018]
MIPCFHRHRWNDADDEELTMKNDALYKAIKTHIAAQQPTIAELVKINDDFEAARDAVEYDAANFMLAKIGDGVRELIVETTAKDDADHQAKLDCGKRRLECEAENGYGYIDAGRGEAIVASAMKDGEWLLHERKAA